MEKTILSCMAVLCMAAGSAVAIEIQVPANTPYPHWYETSVYLEQGGCLYITASGTWAYGGGPDAWNGPQGNGEPGVPTSLVPGAPAYSLVGRIGDGPGFEVGAGGTFGASKYGTGTLWLAHNDQVNGYSDNQGFVTVTVTMGVEDTTGTGPTLEFAGGGTSAGSGWTFDTTTDTFSFGASFVTVVYGSATGDPATMTPAYVHLPDMTVGGGPGAWTLSGGTIRISDQAGTTSYLVGILAPGDLVTVGSSANAYTTFKGDIDWRGIANTISSDVLVDLFAVETADLAFSLFHAGPISFQDILQRPDGQTFGDGLTGSMSITTPPPATVTIRGTVYDDAYSLKLQGATVTAGLEQTQTDPNGEYEISALPPGQVSVTVSKEGFQTATKDVTIEAGQTRTLDDFRLQRVGAVVIQTGFLPSENGFHFANPDLDIVIKKLGYCLGMSYAALNYYFLGIEVTADEEHPDPLNPQWLYIQYLQSKYSVESALSAMVIFLIDNPVLGSYWVESQCASIRSLLQAGIPCPVALGGQASHMVVAYKVIEIPFPWGEEHLVYVYDSVYPDDDCRYLVTRCFSGVWTMNYGMYTSFGAIGIVPDILIDIPLAFVLHSPATLRVTDPDGLVIEPGHSDGDGGYYRVSDVDGDGHEEQAVFVLVLKPGTYTVEVIPEPGADPDATYSLIAMYSGIPTVLADNVKISDIPAKPYEVVSNRTPVAHAGIDQTVYVGMNGKADVMLDGSASSDPDGDTLTYEWTWTIGTQTYQAHGASPTIELPVGVHAIQLVVNDGIVDSEADQVVITARAPEQQAVDSLVSASVGRPALDAKTRLFSVNVTVRNTSNTVIAAPVWLVIQSISNPAVTAANTSGTTADGKPYIDLSGLLSNGTLDPGEVVSQRIYFNNPKRVSFTFKSSVRGVISP